MKNRSSIPVWNLVSKDFFITNSNKDISNQSLGMHQIRMEYLSEKYDANAYKLFVHPDVQYNLENPSHYKFTLFHGFKKLETYVIKSDVVLFEHEKLCFISDLLLSTKIS